MLRCFTSLSDLNRQTFPAPSSPPIRCKLYPSATVSLEFPALYPIPGIQLAVRNGNANDGKSEGGLGRVWLYYTTRPSLSYVFFFSFFFFQSAAPIALFSIALHFITSKPGTTLASISVLA